MLELDLRDPGNLKVYRYMTDFFLFARSSLPNVLISTAKKFFHSDFPFPCFDVPKASNFTSGGVQNRETKNRGLGKIVTSIQDCKPHKKQISPMFSYFLITNALLYHFWANWLAHNKKMTEKSVFFVILGVLNWCHNSSQSPVFGVTVLYPTGSEIWRFWHIKTWGKKIAIEKFFCYTYQHIGEI